jgi:uncharacterized membrane protein
MDVVNYTPSYGRCFASLALGMSPFFLILGVSALFGANTVTSGGENVHGIGALFVALIVNVVFAAIFAGLQKLGYVMLGVFRWRRGKAGSEGSSSPREAVGG